MIATREELVERARKQTGLSDLGADGWQVGLDRLRAAARVDLGGNAEAVAQLEAFSSGGS